MQKKHIFYRLLLWLWAAIPFSCSENPHQLTLNILDGDVPGMVKDTTLFAIADTSYQVRTKVNNQYSLRLILGQLNNFEARPILRFTSYLTLPDSAIVDSAKIQLSSAGIVSSGEPLPFIATIYPALSVWTSNVDSVWSDYQQNIDKGKPLAQLQIDPRDTLGINYIFTLNSDGIDLTKVWADTGTHPDDNYGVMVDFDQANFLQYFYAINSTRDPKLLLTYHLPSDTSVYRDTLNGTYDAFVYQGDFPKVDQRNYVSSLLVNHTLLKFDLLGFFNSQPKDISLLSANLQLPLDLENSLIDPHYSLANQVTLKLQSDFTDPAIVIDSTKNRFALATRWASDSSYIEISADDNRKKLSEILRLQLNEPDSSIGLVLSFIDSRDPSSTFSDELEFFSYLAYFKRTYPDADKHPRLKITYWVPASPRL